MKRRTLLIATFTASVALSVVAASYRFGDSAHAMGLISGSGGRAHHPVHLPPGGERYTLIVTSTVLPPYRGDVTVAVEGEPAPRFEVHPSEPVIDLGVRRRPHFREGAFRGVEPGDRLALWLRIAPPEVDPVCGHAVTPEFIALEHEGKTVRFCSERCRDTFLADTDRAPVTGTLEGRYRVAFRDAASGEPVLEIPLLLGDGGGRQSHGH
jgi:YHS domain-containing protein